MINGLRKYHWQNDFISCNRSASSRHLFVPAGSQDMDFQCHMPWVLLDVQLFEVRGGCSFCIGRIVDHNHLNFLIIKFQTFTYQEYNSKSSLSSFQVNIWDKAASINSMQFSWSAISMTTEFKTDKAWIPPVMSHDNNLIIHVIGSPVKRRKLIDTINYYRESWIT